MKLMVISGLPASGKTTWSRKYVSKNKQWVRVNRDDLRNMRGKYWVPSQEDLITQWEDWCVLLALNAGYNVVLDATNLNQQRIQTRINAFKEQSPGLVIEQKFFDTPLLECIKRDNQREKGVGESVIRGMYDKYLKLDDPIYIEDDSLPTCVICDIDGTLALMGDRSPYDWNRVGEDSVNESVASLLADLAPAVKIILLSGRDGSCLTATETWLSLHNIVYDALYMRDAGNTESDEIIKGRMFEDHVRGKYYCKFVLDDRDKVVGMWREIKGLSCFQVNYGNF